MPPLVFSRPRALWPHAWLSFHSYSCSIDERKPGVFLLERVPSERPGLERRQLEPYGVKVGVVEGGTQRLLGGGPRADGLGGAVGLHDLLLVRHEISARDDHLEERRREAREHLRVRRVLGDWEADRRAEVPEDNARRGPRLAARSLA